MIARVKWCKPVSSCTRLRPNVKCFNIRKGGKLATLSEIHSCCRNVVECAIDLAVTRRMYPLDRVTNRNAHRSELGLVLKRVEILLLKTLSDRIYCGPRQCLQNLHTKVGLMSLI